MEVNNIQFLKINMSKYESSRNTQPFHVNSFMLAKAYWQLNFFKKINMTTCFVPVEIISTTIDGPPGPTRPDSGHHPRSHSLGFGRWRWGPRLGAEGDITTIPSMGTGIFTHIWISLWIYRMGLCIPFW